MILLFTYFVPNTDVRLPNYLNYFVLITTLNWTLDESYSTWMISLVRPLHISINTLNGTDSKYSSILEDFMFQTY